MTASGAASVGPDADAQGLLYLFSSNASPQYEQDVLNVLAAPSGAEYVFRYSEKYVAQPVLDSWTQLDGRPALVCFSMQDEEMRQEPLFIPVRAASIEGTHEVGSQRIVRFKLGDLVTLPVDGLDAGNPKPLAIFSAWLRLHVPDTPYAKSLTLGPSALDQDGLVLVSDDQARLFEASTRWLDPPFKNARFLRFDRIVGENYSWLSYTENETAVELVGARTYELRLVHFQPERITAKQRFRIVVDAEVISVIGRPEIEIASRYDEVRIRLRTQPVQRAGAVESTLLIEPDDGVEGPVISLPLRVKAPRFRSLLNVLVPVLVLAAIGIPGLTGWDTLPKIMAVTVGLILAALFQYYGGVGSLGTSNVYGTPTPPAPTPPTHGGQS